MVDGTHANRAAMEELVANLRARLDTVKKGGGEKAVTRHKERGKMFVRERIDAVAEAGRQPWRRVRDAGRADGRCACRDGTRVE